MEPLWSPVVATVSQTRGLVFEVALHRGDPKVAGSDVLPATSAVG